MRVQKYLELQICGDVDNAMFGLHTQGLLHVGCSQLSCLRKRLFANIFCSMGGELFLPISGRGKTFFLSREGQSGKTGQRAGR